jgi:hypothetical protein
MDLTFENFWSKLKTIKRLMGVDDSPPKVEGMAPDDFFAQAMSGAVNPEDFGIEVTKMDESEVKRKKQEQSLRSYGLMR